MRLTQPSHVADVQSEKIMRPISCQSLAVLITYAVDLYGHAPQILNPLLPHRHHLRLHHVP